MTLGCLPLGALFLPARKGYWLDLDRELTEAYLGGMSYCQVRAVVERKIDSEAGLRSLWRRFQEIARVASAPGLGQSFQGRMVLPWAQQRLCLWHQLHNLALGLKERCPG